MSHRRRKKPSRFAHCLHGQRPDNCWAVVICGHNGHEWLRVFSLHAPTGMGAYQKLVNSIFDMLLNHRDGCEMVIEGDFNLTVSKRHGSEKRFTEEADLKIQDRLTDEFGLINCWQKANPDTPHAQTLRWDSNGVIPFHCDGLFAPKSWEPHLRSCNVLFGGIWDDLSDHYPAVAEFERWEEAQ